MNWLDITIIVICAVGIIQGVVKGFVRQAFSVFGLIFGIIIAFRYHDILARYLSKWIQHPVALMILSFILVLVVMLLLFKLIGLAARAAISAVSIGWLDRVAGGAFGLIKAVIIVAVLFGLFILCSNRPTRPVSESVMAPAVMEVSYVIARFLPPQLRDRYDQNEQEIWEHLTSELIPRIKEVRTLEPVISEEPPSPEAPSPEESKSSGEQPPPGEENPS